MPPFWHSKGQHVVVKCPETVAVQSAESDGVAVRQLCRPHVHFVQTFSSSHLSTSDLTSRTVDWATSKRKKTNCILEPPKGQIVCGP